MAKKETRRDASLKLAIVLFLLAISQAFAPPLLLGSRFVPRPHGNFPKIALEAVKHDWLGLAFRKPGSKPHDRIGRIDCLHKHKDPKAHCNTGGGYTTAGLHNAHSDDGGSVGTGFGGINGSGSDGSDTGRDFAIAGLIGGTMGSSDSVGGFGEGSGGAGGGDSIGGGKGGSNGGTGGGTGGGGSGASGPDDGRGAGGGSGGGKGPDDGKNTGGDGSGSGSGGDGGSGDGSGGGNGATIAGEFIHSDPAPNCVTGVTDCIPGDPGGSGCSLNNPEACTKGDGDKGGDPDCLEPAFCGTPVINTAVVTHVPEPSTIWLMGAGIAALAARNRRRKPVAARATAS